MSRTATMSPVSADGSEWSELNQYQAGSKPEPTFSQTFPPSREISQHRQCLVVLRGKWA